ncbi:MULTISPECIES: YeeE/YedE family protein [Hyphomicrobiales]|uniref:YeeE/YedE family protein n=1 Tax=Methylobacterium sp. CCH7-A2 TaxID=1768789 RepID=UPI000ABF86F0|nr:MULTISPECIES: YeeE/YedE family protein [Hyphomicrobiales]
MASNHDETARVPLLGLVGGGLGFVLFQATFGFAGSFRAALEQRDFSGFRAQALALALTSAVFFPLLAQGNVFGLALAGFVTPIGVSFVIGAVLFGAGMQIGGGCASGTLFALGGGNARLVMTLAFFVFGSAVGAAHLGFWWPLPRWNSGTMQDWLGWPAALAVHLAIFGAVMRAIPAPSPTRRRPSLRSLVLEPWPLAWGAFGLAAMSVATLLLAGRPWGETAGFTLWGSKIAGAIGFDPGSWPYWQGQQASLSASLFADITSVMDFGIVAGAMLAAGLSARFAVRSGGGARAWLAAALGGFLMGYGARLSDGCNIGAYFSALASGSLSGWVWVAAAFLGSIIGLRLRPIFGLA